MTFLTSCVTGSFADFIRRDSSVQMFPNHENSLTETPSFLIREGVKCLAHQSLTFFLKECRFRSYAKLKWTRKKETLGDALPRASPFRVVYLGKTDWPGNPSFLPLSSVK